MDIEGVIAALDSDNRDEVLKCLYGLSGPHRDLKLPEFVMEALRKLILSADDEISWRAQFLLGLVWGDLGSLPFIVQRLSRHDEDNLVFATGLDAIFVIAQRHPQESFGSSIEVAGDLAQRSRSPELVQISTLLKKFLQREIGEEEYRASKSST